MRDDKEMAADLAESLMEEVNDMLEGGVPYVVIESAMTAVLWHMAGMRREADELVDSIAGGKGTVH